MNTSPQQTRQDKANKAASSQQAQKKGWHLITRQLARIFLFLLAALFLLFVICLLIIRTSWAEKYLTAEIPALLNPILAEQGLSLELDQLQGPLPNRLALKGLRLHDESGLFLEIESIETRLALSELFSGALTIDIFQVMTPTLHRLPALAPSISKEETPGPVTGLSLDLPIEIRLKKIAVEGASLPWAILGLEGAQDANSTDMAEAELFLQKVKASTHNLEGTPPDVSPAAQKEEQISVPASGQVALQVAAQESSEQALAIQKAWGRTLAAPLRLDLTSSAELSQGILNASLALRARDKAPSAQAQGENFDLAFTLAPAHFVLIEADHNTAEISGNLALTLGGTSYALKLETLAEITEEAVRLTDLSLDGLGLSLQSSAEFLLATGQPTADLALSGSDMGDLILLLGALTGENPERLQGLLSPLALEVALTHTSHSLGIQLHNFQAGGVHAKGQATLENIFAEFSPKDSKTSEDQPKTPLNSSETPLTVQARLALEVSALEALSPEIKGALQGALNIQGSLADLHSTVNITSPNLSTASGDLHDFTATIGATLKEDNAGQKALQGSLQAAATPNPLGPTDIRLDWSAIVPPTDEAGLFVSPVTASLQQLRVHIFGLAMEGTVNASLSPQFLSPSSPVQADPIQIDPAQESSLPAGKTANEANADNKQITAEIMAPTQKTPSQPTPKGSSQGVTLLWPEGLTLDGTIQASVEDWNPLSAFAQTPLSGKNTALAIALHHTKTSQQATITATSDSFNAPAQGFSLASLNLKADALVPIQKGTLPSLALSLSSGQGEAANIPWRSITATVTDEGGKGHFALAMVQDTQKILHKKAVAAQKGKKGQENALSEPPKQSKQADSLGSNIRQRPSLPQNTRFTTKLNKDELLALQGQYHLQDMGISLDKLALIEPFSQTEIQLRDSARITLGEGLRLDGLTLDVSSGGSISAEIAQSDSSMLAKATITTLPLRFINDVAGSTLPPGHINADVFMQTSQQTPKGTVDFQLHLDKAGQGADTRQEISLSPSSPSSPQTFSTTQLAQNQTSHSQADIHLQASIIQSGRRSYLAGGLDFSHLAGKLPVSASHLATSQSAGTVQSTAPLTFKIPLSVEGGVPLPDVNAPFQANLLWQGPLDGFWRLVPLPDTEFSALASIDLGLSGTLAAPKTGGTAYVAQGHVYDKGLGLLLTNMALEAHASQDEEYRLVFAAEDGDKGSLGLEGVLQLKGIPHLNLRGQLKRLAPLHRDDVKITLTGLLGANGPLHAPKVSADILVERGEIELLAAMGNGSVRTLPITDPSATVEEADGAGGELDVTVTIPKRFYIRGLGLDSEWQGKLNINGAFSEPQIIGSLSPVRGYFELISKPFAFTGGEIVFVGGSKINPGLDLELTYTTNELEAIIKAGGNLEKPELDLQSNPPLPKDEVLAHVLFGKKISELSRFEALQLANSMSELAGISSGNLNPLTTMRKATGLDVLRFGSDDDSSDQRKDSGMTGASNLGTPKKNGDSATESAPTLEAGKYITDNIYIGVEQGMTQESTGVRVEIELFPNTTLQGKSTANSSSAGIGWKMDY